MGEGRLGARWTHHEDRRMRAIVGAVVRRGGSRTDGMREAARRLERSFATITVRFSILRRAARTRRRLGKDGGH